MGQQQLLLLVLAIVIVGLAVVAGIQAFAENQRKANIDGLTMTSTRLAVEAQSWLRTPIMRGGGMPETGDRPSNFLNITLDFGIMGYPVNGNLEYQDIHGFYKGEVVDSDFVIRAFSANSSGDNDDNNVVCVTITGTSLGDITTEINPPGGTCSS